MTPGFADHMTTDSTEPILPPDLGGTIIQSKEAQARARDASTAGAETKAPTIPGYTLTDPLGRGTFATAWQGVQTRTGKPVAIKVFHQSSGVNWLFLRREVERLVRLDKHPHVVSLLDADLGHDPPYYVTDLMEGGSLEKFVEPAKPAVSTQVAGWADEIAQALSFVHGKGIIHCDLKPANILLDSEGRVRVADFGQARVLAEGQGALGTLFYMAPEQAQIGDAGANLQPDVRWDLYALGATAYALLTGKAPYADTLTSKLESSSVLDERLKVYRALAEEAPDLKLKAIKGLDEDLAAIVGKLMAVKPEARYGSAGEVLDDLGRRRDRRPVGPLSRHRSYRIKRYLQRNAAAVGIAAAAALGLAGLGVRLYLAHREVSAALVRNLLVRAQQYSQQGDYASAAATYAGLDRLSPSRLARRNALAHLARLLSPVRVFRHARNIRWVSLSPDGTRVATGHHDNTARLWDAATGRPIGEILRHPTDVMAGVGTAFSPDGRILATASPADKEIRFWNAVDGTPRSPAVCRHVMGVDNLVFSPDSRYLAGYGGTAGGIVIVDCRDLAAKALKGENQKGGNTKSVVFTADSQIVVQAGSALGSFHETRTGRTLGQFSLPGTFANWVTAERAGQSVLLGDNNGGIRRIAQPGKPPVELLRHPSGATGVAVSPDGGVAVSCSTDGTIVAWAPRDGARKWAAALHCWITAVHCLPGGRVLAVMLDRSVRLLEGAGESGTRQAMAFHLGKDVNACTSRDGRWLATCDGSSVATLWSLDRTPLRRAIDENGWSSVTAVSGDVRRAWRLTYDPALVPWDLEGLKPTGDPIALPSVCYALAVSADGTRAAAGDAETGRIYLVDLAARKVLDKALSLESGIAMCLAFSVDGSRLLACGSEGWARLWDARTGDAIGPPLARGDQVRIGRFSPDGRRAFTMGTEVVRCWSAVDGKPAGEIRHPGGSIQDLALSPDGTMIATGGGDGKVRLWNVLTGAALGVVSQHDQYVYRLAFSPDGRFVLSGGADGNARFNRVRSGEPHGRPMAHRWGICAVGFSPDGKTAATGIWSGEVQLWDVESAEPLGPPMDVGGPPVSIVFSPSSDRVVIEAGAIPQIQIWDTGWLAADLAGGDFEDRIAAASRMRLGPQGNLDPVPPEEYEQLVGRLGSAARR